MALIIEDGTIVAGANSYVTVAELDSWATLYGITLNAADEAAKEVIILKGAAYVESFRAEFDGNKVESTQPMQWPRENVTIDGFDFPSNEIPQDLKNAQLQAAVETDAGADLQANQGQTVKREKVDVIEVEYMDGSSSSTSYEKINAYLDALLKSSASMGGSILFGQTRG